MKSIALPLLLLIFFAHDAHAAKRYQLPAGQEGAHISMSGLGMQGSGVSFRICVPDQEKQQFLGYYETSLGKGTLLGVINKAKGKTELTPVKAEIETGGVVTLIGSSAYKNYNTWSCAAAVSFRPSPGRHYEAGYSIVTEGSFYSFSRPTGSCRVGLKSFNPQSEEWEEEVGVPVPSSVTPTGKNC